MKTLFLFSVAASLLFASPPRFGELHIAPMVEEAEEWVTLNVPRRTPLDVEYHHNLPQPGFAVPVWILMRPDTSTCEQVRVVVGKCPPPVPQPRTLTVPLVPFERRM
jgi:hypothetical protein